jgi:hypothetical protein
MNRVADGLPWDGGGPAPRDFLKRIGEACAAFPVDLHAFCVLPRHYHVLARAERDALRAALTSVESESGFPGATTLRDIPVAFGRHLTAVSRYIHLNPVDAGLVWYPEQWPYSSFRAYLGDLEAPAWISTQAVLGRFGVIGARHRHRAYVYAGMDPGTRDADGRPKWSRHFGDACLADDLAWRVEPVLVLRARRPVPSMRVATLPSLARAVAEAFDVSVEAMRTVRAGGTPAARARGALVHVARAQGLLRLRDVAAFMGYASPAAAAAAAERFDQAVRIDPALRIRVVEAVGRAAVP